jgi:hypothetical protein
MTELIIVKYTKVNKHSRILYITKLMGKKNRGQTITVNHSKSKQIILTTSSKTTISDL